MRWKVMRQLAGSNAPKYNWSLGYPTKTAAQAAARRLNATAQYPKGRFSVDRMTPEDEALASELERHQ